MSINRIKAYIVKGRRDTYGFFVLSAFFFFGALLGAISANFVSMDNTRVLKELFINSGSLFYTNRGLQSVLLTVLSHNIILIILGFAVFGFVLIPPLAGVRGFLLSFSAAALIRALGKGGVLTALARFGPSALISLPCFFILCFQSFNASCELTGKTLSGRSPGLIYDRNYFLRCAICIAALVLSAFIETYITPFLAAAVGQ